MPLYSRYIARQLAHSTLLITVSITSIVWLLQALRYIEFIIDQGVSVWVYLKLVSFLIPMLVATILPPAFFCGALFVYSKLRSDSELVVMQAMGLDRWKLALPSFHTGLVLMLLGYGLTLYLQPISVQAFRDMQLFLRTNYASILLQEGVFNTPINGLTVFVRERHDDGLLKGIFVHDARKQGSAITMMADRGRLVQTPSGPRFLLEQGSRQEMNKGKLSFLNYDNYALDVTLYTQSSRNGARDVQEMYLTDLLRHDDTVSLQENNKRKMEGHTRILWPAYIPILALLAALVLLSGEFSRRSAWKRVTAACIGGAIMLIGFATLKGVLTSYPDMAWILYGWWSVPIAIIWLVLRRTSGSYQRAAA